MYLFEMAAGRRGKSISHHAHQGNFKDIQDAEDGRPRYGFLNSSYYPSQAEKDRGSFADIMYTFVVFCVC